MYISIDSDFGRACASLKASKHEKILYCAAVDNRGNPRRSRGLAGVWGCRRARGGQEVPASGRVADCAGCVGVVGAVPVDEAADAFADRGLGAVADFASGGFD